MCLTFAISVWLGERQGNSESILGCPNPFFFIFSSNISSISRWSQTSTGFGANPGDSATRRLGRRSSRDSYDAALARGMGAAEAVAVATGGRFAGRIVASDVPCRRSAGAQQGTRGSAGRGNEARDSLENH